MLPIIRLTPLTFPALKLKPKPNQTKKNMKTTEKQAIALARWYGENWRNEVKADLEELKANGMPSILHTTFREFAESKAAARSAFWQLASK